MFLWNVMSQILTRLRLSGGLRRKSGNAFSGSQSKPAGACRQSGRAMDGGLKWGRCGSHTTTTMLTQGSSALMRSSRALTRPTLVACQRWQWPVGLTLTLPSFTSRNSTSPPKVVKGGLTSSIISFMRSISPCKARLLYNFGPSRVKPRAARMQPAVSTPKCGALMGVYSLAPEGS